MPRKRIKKSNMDKKCTFRIDARRLVDLEDYADREGTNVSFVVRHLVTRFLEKQKQLNTSWNGPSPMISENFDSFD